MGEFGLYGARIEGNRVFGDILQVCMCVKRELQRIWHIPIYFIASGGERAYHYLHCLRPDSWNEHVLYASCFLEEYDLSKPLDRNRFRKTLNLLHVYHAAKIKDRESERMYHILSLDPIEIGKSAWNQKA